MSKRGRNRRNYKSGAYTGGHWSEYRHGRPVSVKQEPIYRGQARQHVIQRIMDVLRDWRLSPFENEAACRAGLRSALCLKGHGWQRSDSEAASIVAEGLRLLGAVRPTWEQGQREYSIPKENCSWCHAPLEDELLFGQRRYGFCSDVCARSALQMRDYEGMRNEFRMFRDAHDVILRKRNPAQPCLQCGVMFLPLYETSSFCSKRCQGAYSTKHPPRPCQQCGNMFKPRIAVNRFCSTECRDASRRTLPEIACVSCGERFFPKKAGSKFCSKECYSRHGGPATAIRRICVWCSTPFDAFSNRARACSETCQRALINLRNGKMQPKRLTPPVWDYIVAMAA